MTPIAFCRAFERVVAPLCEGRTEGAQATEGGQDKSDSLRPCRAVVLSLRFKLFEQAANSTDSLPVSTSHYSIATISTSRGLAHVR